MLQFGYQVSNANMQSKPFVPGEHFVTPDSPDTGKGTADLQMQHMISAFFWQSDVIQLPR